jgi:hypothetical protein
MNPVRAGLSLVVALLVLAAGFWGWNAYRDRQQARRTVAEAEAERQAAVVASLEAELRAARTEAGRVDTLIRTVLRNPPPVRPVAPPAAVLDTLGRDSLRTLVTVLEAYSDTVERENTVLRATLDTAQRVTADYRLLADSTIAAQARQITALNVVVRTPKPRRRWGVGGACGYGLVAGGGRVSSGPGCVGGLSFAF